MEKNMRTASYCYCKKYREVRNFLKAYTILTAMLLISYLFIQVKADLPFGSNVRVNEIVMVPGTASQNGPSIAVDDVANIYIAWGDDRNGNSDIYFANSTDGGITFSAHKKINDDGGETTQYNPSIAVDDTGYIYVVWIDERNGDRDVYFAKSNDSGNTFSVNKRIDDDVGGTIQDLSSIAVSDVGDIYVVWMDKRNGDDDIYFANSTDGGNTFSPNKKVNDDAGSAFQLEPSITVDNVGNIYIAWTDTRNGDSDIYFVNSTDGGNIFSSNKKVNDDGVAAGQGTSHIRAKGANNIYLVWEDNRDGNWDIYFANSTDGGNTFSSNKKINDDGSGVSQYNPFIAIDIVGNIYITWDDRRNSNPDIYFANSTDNGVTFSVNKRVNDDVSSTTQNAVSMALDNTGTIYIAWQDNRNGNYDIYYANSTDQGNTFSTNKKLNDDLKEAIQYKSAIAVDDAGNIYIVWQDERNGDSDIYFACSSSGGTNFSVNKKINDDVGAAEQAGPSIAVDNFGNVYIVWYDWRNGDTDIYFANSSDWGNTFSTNKIVNDDGIGEWQDSPSITVDNAGYIYIAWSDYRNGNWDIYFTNSTDFGNTFSTNKKVNDDLAGASHSDSSITALDTGKLYIAWRDSRDGNSDIYFANSTDGGNTFSPNKKVNDDVGSKQQRNPSLAVDSAGNVYIAWYDERNGDSDIYFANSTNGGNTFSANKKVNDDGSSVWQYYPSIAAEGVGNVYIAWEDNRNGFTDTDIYYANSTDGGNTFSINKRVNDDVEELHQSRPDIAVDPVGNVFLVWQDPRGNSLDIYFTTFPLIIFNIQMLDITDTKATIIWRSNRPANSTLEYGLTTAYGFTFKDNNMKIHHSYNLIDLEPGRLYHFRITSYNDSINYSVSRDFTFTTKFPIELEPGWNMISVPLNQIETDLGFVVENISGEYDTVQWFDITDLVDPWKHNHINKPSLLNDLNEINKFMGTWIHITNSSSITLYVDGIAPDIGYVNQITLRNGWNFVGYPSLIKRSPDSSGLPAEVDMVKWYNASSGLWESWDPGGSPDTLNLLKPGQGLWVHYTGAIDLWDLEYVS
jgi:hypothetical protein